MGIHISRSPEESMALGEIWGKEAPAGMLIGLSGDLGAGKTHLVKGIARGLGYSGRVHSPTFTLLNQYAGGKLPLYHLDLSRLVNAEEVRAAGLDEYFSRSDGVTVVEWIDRIDQPVPAQNFLFRSVRIEILGDDSRQISYEDFGA